jgi:hypothetical protein
MDWTMDDGLDDGRWTSIVQVLAFVLKPGRWTIFISYSRFNKFSLQIQSPNPISGYHFVTIDTILSIWHTLMTLLTYLLKFDWQFIK